MRARYSLLALVLTVAFGVAVVAPAAEKKKAAAPPVDEKATAEIWQKMATPAEGHKKLEPFVGSWAVKNTMWMDPSKPPEVTDGTSENQ